MKLEETADEGAINANPNLALGPFNDSGWKNIAQGGRFLIRDGKTVFDTQYGSRSQDFPVVEPGTYALSAKATPNGFNSSVHVDVHDAKGKSLLRVSTRRYGPPTHFVLPEGAASASFLAYSCLLEEIKLVRVGDESAIKSLK